MLTAHIFAGTILLLHNYGAYVALILAEIGLGNAEQHCTYGQLFVLHCGAADYQSGKSFCEPKSNELKLDGNYKAQMMPSYRIYSVGWCEHVLLGLVA